MTERDYFEIVKTLAIEAVDEAVESGEIEEYEDFIPELVECVPCLQTGIGRVKDTSKCKKVLEYTRNDNAYLDAVGIEIADFKDGIPWAKFAYWALAADVRDRAEMIAEDRIKSL